MLVTVDRGETRVAILEAEGTPPAKDGAQNGPDGGRAGRGRGRGGSASAANGKRQH